jgi:hypothetical protein
LRGQGLVYIPAESGQRTEPTDHDPRKSIYTFRSVASLSLLYLIISTALVAGPEFADSTKQQNTFSDMSKSLSGTPFRPRIGATGNKVLIEPFASGCGVRDYDGDGDLTFVLSMARTP